MVLEKYNLSEEDYNVIVNARLLIEEYGESNEPMTKRAINLKRAINEYLLENYVHKSKIKEFEKRVEEDRDYFDKITNNFDLPDKLETVEDCKKFHFLCSFWFS